MNGAAASFGGGAADGDLRRKIEDYKAREHIYLAGLIEQDGHMNRLKSMTSDVLGAYGDLSQAALRGALSDPVCNMEVLMLRQKAHEKEQLIRQLREELESNKFDQQAPQGQQLMQKCRLLLEENHELGQQLHQERMAEVAEVLAAAKRENEQLEQKLVEAANFCKELGQESDMLQGTVAQVAGKLRQASAELDAIKRVRGELKAKRKREKEQQEITAGAPQAISPAAELAGSEALPAELAQAEMPPPIAPAAVPKRRPQGPRNVFVKAPPSAPGGHAGPAGVIAVDEEKESTEVDEAMKLPKAGKEHKEPKERKSKEKKSKHEGREHDEDRPHRKHKKQKTQ